MVNNKYYTTDATALGSFIDIPIPTVPETPYYFPTYDANNWFIQPGPSIIDFSDVLNWARNLLDMHGFADSEFAFIRDLGTCAAMLKRSYNDKTELSIEDCLKIRNHISELISNNRPTLVGRRKYLEDLILTNVKINGRALSAIEYSLNAKFSYCKRKCRYIKG